MLAALAIDKDGALVMRWYTVAAIFSLSVLSFAGLTSAASLLDDVKKGLKDATGSPSTQTGTTAGANLSTNDITAGLLDALKVGTERVLGQVGKTDGFNLDPNIHIPLPKSMRDAQTYMKQFGLSGMADDLELKLNRAAETAAPQTKQVFWDAIKAMSFEDARAIYSGPDDAATQYFRRVASDDLGNVIRPIVDEQLESVGAVKAYDDLMSQYGKLPLVPDIKANLSDHAVAKSLKGIFYYLGKEEAAIRNNPAMRTTDILEQVFGG
jgi:hypothetical protein